MKGRVGVGVGVVLGLAGGLSAGAAEGMWLPTQVKDLAPKLSEAGIAVPAAALADPKAAPLGAVVGLGFCTASFVSADGLLVTNAHCAEGYLAQSSTAEHNRVEEGYTAGSRAEELPAGPSARLYVVETITDVTDTMRAVVADTAIADADRLAAVERTQSALVAKCEKEAGHSCQVVKQFSGSTWQLVKSLELRDVRVVYSPPSNVAYFGGDLDNFEWPRHDGDFAFLRAYVGKNGKPADPAPSNVPYHPPVWLKIEPSGIKQDAPVLVAGYPGATDRYATVAELTFQRDSVFPTELADTLATEKLLADAMAASPEAASRLQSTANELANGRKYEQGILDNVAASTMFDDKAKREAELLAWAKADSSRQPVATAAREIGALVAAQAARYPTDHAVYGLLDGTLASVAYTAYRWADEHRKKKDGDRQPGFQDRDKDDLLGYFASVDTSMWLPYERTLLADRLARYAALPADKRVAAIDAWLDAHGGVTGALDALFTDPALARAPDRAVLLETPVAALEASKDPWVQLAVAIEQGYARQARIESRARRGAMLRYEPIFASAMRDQLGTGAYPDANNTLRITYGRVTGYVPRDGLLATPKTSLAGVLAKDRTDDYDGDDAVIAAAQKVEAAPADGASDPGRRYFDAELGDLPVNFLSDVDTTGGNSGSPTLDANGNLVGLVFDGNYESMAADWQFDARLTRSIHVDIRYILWLLSLDPKATWIAGELTPRS